MALKKQAANSMFHCVAFSISPMKFSIIRGSVFLVGEERNSIPKKKSFQIGTPCVITSEESAGFVSGITIPYKGKRNACTVNTCSLLQTVGYTGFDKVGVPGKWKTAVLLLHKVQLVLR